MVLSKVGAVVIGRNEGERLIRCFDSLSESLNSIIYVDSGSTDASLIEAKNRGITTVPLDLDKPFTAARARNEGARAVLEKYPDIQYIQFVDGDCEVQKTWISESYEFLEAEADFAIVCGRRRERFPDATAFNQLCDYEWDTPIGESLSCGGDALIRVSAYRSVDGYRENMIAGEEPEMCFRMRELGWKIMRIDAEMTLHDAAMTSITQWWKRHKRAGHAYAESNYLHGDSAEKFRLKETRSDLVWAFLLPLILVASAWNWLLVFALAIYPVQVLRLTMRDKRRYKKMSHAILVACSNVCSKFPQTVGILTFYKNLLLGKKQQLIEYK